MPHMPHNTQQLSNNNPLNKTCLFMSLIPGHQFFFQQVNSLCMYFKLNTQQRAGSKGPRRSCHYRGSNQRISDWKKKPAVPGRRSGSPGYQYDQEQNWRELVCCGQEGSIPTDPTAGHPSFAV